LAKRGKLRKGKETVKRKPRRQVESNRNISHFIHYDPKIKKPYASQLIL
jgi:hypothetical protein